MPSIVPFYRSSAEKSTPILIQTWTRPHPREDNSGLLFALRIEKFYTQATRLEFPSARLNYAFPIKAPIALIHLVSPVSANYVSSYTGSTLPITSIPSLKLKKGPSKAEETRSEYADQAHLGNCPSRHPKHSNKDQPPNST